MLFQTDAPIVLNSMFSSMGISNTPSQQTPIQGGITSNGNAYFTEPALANNSDYTQGSNHISAFKQAFSPLGVINDTHSKALDAIGQLVSSPSVYAHLDKNNDDPKALSEAMLKLFNPSINSLESATKTQAGTNAALAAHTLASRWDTLSPAQKSIGLANVGIQGMPLYSGSMLHALPVPGSFSPVDGKAVTVGAVMDGLKNGFNAYPIAKNWGEMDTIGKIAFGTQGLGQGAQVARMLGMVGKGPNGSTTDITSMKDLPPGIEPSPAHGVGAVKLSPQSSVPAGYTLLPDNIAIPTANVHSATTTPQTPLGARTRVQMVADNEHPVVKNWGEDFPHGNAGLGGSALLAGINALSQTNPYVLSGIHAYSMFQGRDLGGENA